MHKLVNCGGSIHMCTKTSAYAHNSCQFLLNKTVLMTQNTYVNFFKCNQLLLELCLYIIYDPFLAVECPFRGTASFLSVQSQPKRSLLSASVSKYYLQIKEIFRRRNTIKRIKSTLVHKTQLRHIVEGYNLRACHHVLCDLVINKPLTSITMKSRVGHQTRSNWRQRRTWYTRTGVLSFVHE